MYQITQAVCACFVRDRTRAGLGRGTERVGDSGLALTAGRPGAIEPVVSGDSIEVDSGPFHLDMHRSDR